MKTRIGYCGNARIALFDAVHFVCHSQLATDELEVITGKLAELHSAFEDSIPQQEGEELIALEIRGS
ncbi:MAG TPA: hypothetical protein VJO16_02655 [Candidatus Acidoferrum sp.]|nr:hypothetical protein [Candidatus Acidoferrum sp.]